ncbi:hypothetical protein HanIR_Chr11g0515111 [Helianthus annuus]|nr:hypothetical protein HanIR_Chr11g0515111 [Helianthus annuus]
MKSKVKFTLLWITTILTYSPHFKNIMGIRVPVVVNWNKLSSSIKHMLDEY